jgi:hypothetical protein
MIGIRFSHGSRSQRLSAAVVSQAHESAMDGLVPLKNLMTCLSLIVVPDFAPGFGKTVFIDGRTSTSAPCRAQPQLVGQAMCQRVGSFGPSGKKLVHQRATTVCT